MTKAPWIAVGLVAIAGGLLSLRWLLAEDSPSRESPPAAKAEIAGSPVAQRGSPRGAIVTRPRTARTPEQGPIVPSGSPLLDYDQGAEIAPPPDVAKPPAAAVRTASGLASLQIRQGNGGDHPAPTSRTVVHYAGWQADGTLIDASLERGEPATLPVNAVIPGFAEALQLMTIGEVRRIWIPAELAYGSEVRPGRPSGALVFDIELLDIEAPTPTTN